MRTLPHIAIGCGAVWAGSRLLHATPSQRPPRAAAGRPDLGSMRNGETGDSGGANTAIDYRLVAFGSVLPDMIDRGLRAALGRGSADKNQHLVGHTLLLNLPLLFAGVGLARRGDWRLLAVSAASFTHLLADPVVRSPQTLFWPLLGVGFPAAPGLGRGLTALTQVAAAAIVATTLLRLQREGRLREFVSRGRL